METNFKLNIQPVLEADNYKNFLVQNSKACLIYVRKNISVIKNIRLYNFFLKWNDAPIDIEFKRLLIRSEEMNEINSYTSEVSKDYYYLWSYKSS